MNVKTIGWKLVGNKGTIQSVDANTCKATYSDGSVEVFLLKELPEYITKLEILKDSSGNINYSHFPQ